MQHSGPRTAVVEAFPRRLITPPSSVFCLWSPEKVNSLSACLSGQGLDLTLNPTLRLTLTLNPVNLARFLVHVLRFTIGARVVDCMGQISPGACDIFF